MSKLMLATTSLAIPDNYIVSENATTTATKGDYVPLSTSWCHSKYPAFSNISYIDSIVKK